MKTSDFQWIMNKLLAVIIILLLPITSYAACGGSYTTVTCTQGEIGTCRQAYNLSLDCVQAAIDASSSGDGSAYQDGVYLPSGSVDWLTSYLNLNGKSGLVIKGAGSSSTVITTSVSSGAGAILSGSLTNRLRVSGIGFIGSNAYAAIMTAGENIRIDNCSFTGSWSNVIYFPDGYHSTGVIDNNTMDVNASSSILYVRDTGANSVSTFNAAIDFGSSDWIFFEDNTVNSRNGFTELIETQYGGKIVTRYNTFTGIWSVLWEQHNTNTHSSVAVGGRAHEAYNNVIKPSVGSYNDILLIRDGTGMFYNNVYDYSISGQMRNYAIRNYRTESGCATSSFTDTAASEYGASYLARCCADTYTNGSFQGEGYPCVGTVYGVRGEAPEPVYFWNNKKTADGTTMASVTEIVTDSSATWALQANREWCISNSGQPASCNGYVLSYAAYTCPHPLTGLTGSCDTTSATMYGTTGYNIETTQYTLSITATNCTVTSSPAGINCGATCNYDYDSGTEVTLSPTCSSGYQNATYSGDCSSATVTMNAAKSCTVSCSVVPVTLSGGVNVGGGVRR